MQLDVIEEGIEELINMERFVLKTKPPKAQATALTVPPSYTLSRNIRSLCSGTCILMGARQSGKKSLRIILCQNAPMTVK